MPAGEASIIDVIFLSPLSTLTCRSPQSPNSASTTQHTKLPHTRVNHSKMLADAAQIAQPLQMRKMQTSSHTQWQGILRDPYWARGLSALQSQAQDAAGDAGAGNGANVQEDAIREQGGKGGGRAWPSASTSMMTESPSLMSPDSMRSAMLSSSSRMIARRSGRAP